MVAADDHQAFVEAQARLGQHAPGAERQAHVDGGARRDVGFVAAATQVGQRAVLLAALDGVDGGQQRAVVRHLDLHGMGRARCGERPHVARPVGPFVGDQAGIGQARIQLGAQRAHPLAGLGGAARQHGILEEDGQPGRALADGGQIVEDAVLVVVQHPSQRGMEIEMQVGPVARGAQLADAPGDPGGVIRQAFALGAALDGRLREHVQAAHDGLVHIGLPRAAA
ncbi:Uncharacterised protein [Bordetella pertussis]|nr:Uncharacterised protein [Bordetella pertussis]